MPSPAASKLQRPVISRRGPSARRQRGTAGLPGSMAKARSRPRSIVSDARSTARSASGTPGTSTKASCGESRCAARPHPARRARGPRCRPAPRTTARRLRGVDPDRDVVGGMPETSALYRGGVMAARLAGVGGVSAASARNRRTRCSERGSATGMRMGTPRRALGRARAGWKIILNSCIIRIKISTVLMHLADPPIARESERVERICCAYLRPGRTGRCSPRPQSIACTAGIACAIMLAITLGYGFAYTCRLALSVVKKPLIDAGIFIARRARPDRLRAVLHLRARQAGQRLSRRPRQHEAVLRLRRARCRRCSTSAWASRRVLGCRSCCGR